MTDPHPHRRASDLDSTQEIEELIIKETNERQRTLLLVVNSLRISLRENTAAQISFQQALTEHQDKLEKHLQDYASNTRAMEAFINQGKGAKKAVDWGWRIIAGLFVLIQALVGVILMDFRNEQRELRNMAHANNVQHAEIYAWIKGKEKKGP